MRYWILAIILMASIGGITAYQLSQDHHLTPEDVERKRKEYFPDPDPKWFQCEKDDDCGFAFTDLCYVPIFGNKKYLQEYKKFGNRYYILTCAHGPKPSRNRTVKCIQNKCSEGPK